MDHLGADGAVFLVRLQRCLATGAYVVQGLCQGFACDVALQLGVKLVHQPDGMKVLAQCETPGGQQTVAIDQIEVPNTRMVVVAQIQPRTKWPLLPVRLAPRTAEEPQVGDYHQAPHKMQAGIEVNLQRRQNVLLCMELRLHIAVPASRQFAWRRRLDGYSRSHLIRTIIRFRCYTHPAHAALGSVILYDTRLEPDAPGTRQGTR